MTTLSCVVIGDGNVLTRCLGMLLTSGFKIVATFTNDVSVANFCEEEGIRVCPRGAAIEKILEAKSFDYLFSINNPRILSTAVLSLPNYFSVNYHDSPLPAYAGVNATSWAILHGETSHGVSWHIVEPGVDTGDILQFQTVKIDEMDSALSLNLKCVTACLESFERLISDIVNGCVQQHKQDLDKRSYFGLYDVPPNLGVLSFDQDSKKTYDLARALEFGNHDNQLGSPKICTSTGCFLVVTNTETSTSNVPSEAEIGDTRPDPGTILDIVDETLVIATQTDNLLVSVAELDGHHLTSGSFEKYDLERGARLAVINDLDYNAAKDIRKKEPFWRRRMKTYEPTTFFIQKLNMLSNILDHNENYQVKTVTIKLPEVAVPNAELCTRDFITASFILFVGRVCCTSEVHLGLFSDKQNIKPSYRSLYSDICPGVFTLDFSAPIAEAIETCVSSLTKYREGKTFLLDMFYRYPELRGIKRVPHHNIVLGFGSENYDDYLKTLTDSNLFVMLEKEDITVIFEDKPGNSYAHVVDVLTHFPTFLKSLGITMQNHSTLLEVQLISSDEIARFYHQPSNVAENESQDLLDAFMLNCQQKPRDLALISSDNRLTYGKLHCEVTRLADRLRLTLPNDCKQNNKCVGIYLPNSVAYVVSVMATTALKCPFLPVAVDLPVSRLAFMLQDAGVSFLLTKKTMLESDKVKDLMKSSDVLFEENSIYGDLVMLQFELDLTKMEGGTSQGLPEVYSFTSLDTVGEEHPLDTDCCYVMYTSGSTGKPKGVQVKRSSVLNMAEAQIKAWDLGPDDTIAQFASIGFDATISEIFTALLSGACLAVLHDTERLGKELAHALTTLKVTVITLPPSVLNIYGPKDFPTLKKVITAGEACTVHTAAKWTETGMRLFNAYGPTETTVCATIHEYLRGENVNSSSQDLPIGKAITGVYVYLLDDFMKPVPSDVIGEIYIGGKGVSAGYTGHAASKTKERFVEDPFDKESILYRTGDHAIHAADGTLTYVGRLDDQVKIRGQRVDLSEIEQIIMQHSKVDMAIVVKHQSPTSSDANIAAFVAPTFVYTSELREYLSKALPKYMIPAYIKKMEVKDFPLTLSGKVDRKKLERDESVYETNSNVGNSHLSHTQLAMAKLWCQVLQLNETYAYNMHRLSTFSEHGGNSLHMVLLQRAIEEEFHVMLSFTDIGSASTIEDFGDIIKRKKDLLRTPTVTDREQMRDLNEKIKRDSILQTQNSKLDNISDLRATTSESLPKNILLSGATGFLGAFLLREIMEQCDSHVCCMVRETDEVRGYNRVVSNMRKYDLWQASYGCRIAIVLSDLSQPKMGIAPDIYNALCTEIDIVFMNAAKMNFNTDYEDHRQANVIGTHEFITFAHTGRKKFMFLTSSLAVFLFPPKRGMTSNEMESTSTKNENVQSNSKKKQIADNRELPAIIKQKEKLETRSSLNDLNKAMKKESLMNVKMDVISLNGYENKIHGHEGHCYPNGKQYTQNDIHQNSLDNTSAFVDGTSDTCTMKMKKNALRKTKSVDVSFKEIMLTPPQKPKKRVRIVTETDEKENNQKEIKRIVYYEKDCIRDPALLSGGYGQSKWASEQLVSQALEKLPGGAIFRPARVSGHSKTGVGPSDDLFALTLRGMEKLGAIPDMDFPFDLTPVNFCATGMVEIMLQMCCDVEREMPRVYHFFNKSTVPFSDIFGETSVTKLPLEQWRKLLKTVDRENPLLPLTPFFESDFWDRSCDWPLFSTSNTDKYTSDACRKLMLSSQELLQVYRAYFDKQKLIYQQKASKSPC